MKNSSWFRHLGALAACALWLAGCFGNESAGGDPKPEPPEGLSLAYDTAAGVVTATWNASLGSSDGYYILTRTDSLDGKWYGSETMPTDDTIYRDTLFGATRQSLQVTSHYTVQSVLRRESEAYPTSDPSPQVRGVFPSPLALELILGYGKSVAVRRADFIDPDTLVFLGFAASGHPLDSVSLSFGKDKARLPSAPAGLALVHTPWSPGRNAFDFRLDGRLRVLVGACAPGDYYLHASARAGRFQVVDSVFFKVSADDPVVTRAISMGAQNSPTLGGFLDLDAFRAHTAAGARAAAADIDLVFAMPSDGKWPALYSPRKAADSLKSPAGEGWVEAVLGDQARMTELRKLPDGFESISTVADLETAWSLYPAIPEGRVPMMAGIAFLARSDRGMPAALRVVSVDSSANGTLDLEVKALWPAF